MNAEQTLRESSNPTMTIAGAVSDGRTTLLKLMAQLNIEFIRVYLVHRFSFNILNTWILTSVNERQNSAVDAGSDSAELESTELDPKFRFSDSLRINDPLQTKTRQLSPQLWSFSWLDGSEQLVSVKVRYTEPRELVDAKDVALVRLLSFNYAHEQALESKLLAPDPAEDITLRLGRQRSFRRLSLGLMLMLCLSVLLAGWFAFFAAPAADNERLARQAEASRWESMADHAVIEHLSKALAAGDYGDLQDELSGFHSMGFYARGIVVNPSKRVIASVGDRNVASIGQTIPQELPPNIRSVPLKQGNQELGHFIYPQRPAPSEITSFSGLKSLAAANALAAVFAGVFFLMLLRRRRVNTRPVQRKATPASPGNENKA